MTYKGPDDCISRKAAFESIRPYTEPCIIRMRLMSLPSIQPKQMWIPVSERLPDEKDYCLCCDKDGYMTIGFISKYSKEWCFDDDEIDIDVIAWMPLPEPYKEPQEDEEDDDE